MGNLGTRVARSGAWVFGIRFVHQVFYLGRLIILARLLAPRDFGLMGIALLTMMTLETFSQTGFQQALIQKKENIKNYLDAAWTVLVIRGVILFSIIVLIAPLIAKFFETPQAKGVVQAIGLAVLIQAFTNVGVIYFKKELEFNKQFVYITAGTITDFTVAVTAAFLLRSVWALLFGLIAGKLAQLIVSYIIHPYKPKFSLDFHKARELFGFGKWVLGSSILILLITQGDDLLVGKILGVTMLGFYQMAYRFSNTPATEITHVISSVAYPAYSKLQENLDKLRDAYFRVLKVVTFLTFPLTAAIFVLTRDFVVLFMGDKWSPMIPAMRILAFAGLFRSIAAISGPLFLSIGKPKIDTKMQAIRFCIIAVFIYPFIKNWGIEGASWVIVGSIFIT
ncbi:MAG: oligosaccharide flippase family protein, partial [Candidatus Aminicenantes bacterium]|nr:oligosaccharide flippase family protein [Candidatus Aminicenantes bacterium]